MKKIIFTATTDLNYDQRMQRICHAMAESGYEVLLVGRKQPRSIALDTASYSQKRLKCFFHSGKLFYLEYNIRLFLYLLLQKTDAICAIDLDTLLPGFLVARLGNKKLVFDAHEYFSELPEIQDRPFTKYIWSALESFLVPKVKYAYTVGAALAEALQNRYKTPFDTIRNLPTQATLPTQTEIAEQAKALITKYPNETILLYQGAINKGRGIELIILALEQLPQTRLWIAGKGPLEEQILNLIKEKRVEDKVDFWGYLTPAQLQTLSPFAHIGLDLLSSQGLNYYYSLTNKTFDYLRADLPAIHMDYPEYQRLNQSKPTSLLMKTYTVNEFVKVVQQLQEDKNLYQELKQNCKLQKQIYCWEKEVPRLRAFWERVFAEEKK